MHKEFIPFRPDQAYIQKSHRTLLRTGVQPVDPFTMRHGKNFDKGRVLTDTIGLQIDPRIYRQFAPLAIALALAATSTLCFTNDTHAQQTSQMPDGADQIEIHGGTPITESTAPYLVAMNYKTPEQRFLQCGGAIIGPNAILTAAHCPFPGDEMASIEFTNIVSPTEWLYSDPSKVPPDEVIVASPNKVITHQSYSTIPDILYEGVDLAVVCTQTPITNDTDREQIALPDPTTTITDALIANPIEQVAGWGYTGLMYGEGLPSDIANVITLPTSHSRDCERKLPIAFIVPDYKHCGGDGSFLDEATNNKPIPNAGDSGSPSVVKDRITGKDVILGVVSSRMRQFQMNLFNNVPGFTDFILEAAEECKTHLDEPPPQDALDAKLTLTTPNDRVVPLGTVITVEVNAQTVTNQPVHDVELDAKIDVFTCGPSTITPGAGYTTTTTSVENDLYSVTIRNETDDSTMAGKVATVTLDTNHHDCAPGGDDTFKPFEGKTLYVALPGRLYIDPSKNTASSIRYRTPDDRVQEEIIMGGKTSEPQKITVKPPVTLSYTPTLTLQDGQTVALANVNYYDRSKPKVATINGTHVGNSLEINLEGINGDRKNGQLLLSILDPHDSTQMRYAVLNLEEGNGSVTIDNYFTPLPPSPSPSTDLFLPIVTK